MAPMKKKSYHVVDFVLKSVHLFGWGIIALGVIGGGLSALWNVTNPFYFALGGIAMVINGLLVVAISQLGQAMVDTAKNTQEMVLLTKAENLRKPREVFPSDGEPTLRRASFAAIRS